MLLAELLAEDDKDVISMEKYVLGVDVWQGNLDIQEDVLWDGGVRFLIIRLNSIDGSTHKDDNFGAQWEQSERFHRAPYFVYNPWLTGAQNVEWLGDNMPAGCRRVFYDIEVKRTGYPPLTYAAEVSHFYAQASKFWRGDIYTGGWFVPLLASWPEGASYWWARYPWSWYPPAGISISWEGIISKAMNTVWNPNCELGPCLCWQLSGDRMKPPGCAGRAIDINLFDGNEADIAAYFGTELPVSISWAQRVTVALRELGKEVGKPE